MAPVRGPRQFVNEGQDIYAKMMDLESELTRSVVEADSLEQARARVAALIPPGSELFFQRVIADGIPQTITATGKDCAEAYAAGRKRVPERAEILQQKELNQPARRTATVDAFDEAEARAKVQLAAEPHETIEHCRQTEPAERRLLGLWRKPGRYEASVLKAAEVQLVFKERARIEVTVGKKELVDRIRQMFQRASTLSSGVPESRAASSPISCR